ncbi:tetratricopeptide repeat protein [Planktothrix sp. FACHB-1355]|uniref:Tetratricopeptide repeat protein n=1 Tax=Aerosakkonema funiforme FACHB-1375 TaxID=2949571 RepID=A0A926VAL1_9CYAN|nr:MULTISPECIES: tetratricopeptide repeat protein [Oscillatoriales]MBD2179838.1 tetratricopeptide repeat protein [Aerosakkonema funiforme FACHB-1375]MBD3561910.1 tetratricopeptide repeat protein [Planktothrix sp. FACHB-1355]
MAACQEQANALDKQGDTYRRLGKYQQAIECYRQVLEIKREMGDRPGIAFCLQKLWLCNVWLQNDEEAFFCFMQLQEIHREMSASIEEIDFYF